MVNNSIWNINKLHGWDKNPRGIKKDDFERLKRQIQELGQYKPLLITPDGTVIGGNMRYKAYLDLGIKDIWVSIVEPKDEAELIKYALSDNDRMGYYEDQALAELLQDIDINLDDYKIDVGTPITLNELIQRFGGDDIDFSGIKSTEDREKQFKEHSVTCPNCNKLFTIEI